MLDFGRFRIITFDCYGTLIDWEAGILGVLRSLFPALAARDLLLAYSELEPAIQSGEYKRYRQVLHEVLAGISERFHVPLPAGQENALADSIRHWKPFPDTVTALRRLRSKYQLAVISNIDDDLFAHSARHLEVKFDHVITAQQVGAYKPSLRNFAVAEERIGVERAQWLHAAESIFHDVVPARQLGIANVWVNRRGAKDFGATRMASATPDLEVPDLKTLAELAVGNANLA
jgi:2-haloacid dehalogenase